MLENNEHSLKQNINFYLAQVLHQRTVVTDMAKNVADNPNFYQLR